MSPVRRQFPQFRAHRPPFLNPAVIRSRLPGARGGAGLTMALLTALLPAAGSLAAAGAAGAATPEDAAERIRALEKRVEQLEKLLESRTASGSSTNPGGARGDLKGTSDGAGSPEAARPAKLPPVMSVGASGFIFRSADTNFLLRIRGLLQVDGRWYPSDGGIANNDGFVLRRVRPIVEGRVFRDVEFEITPEFGGDDPALRDAWINYAAFDEVQFMVGKMKPPGSLDRLQSVAYTPFIERSMGVGLWPNRELGAQFHGELWTSGDDAAKPLSSAGLIDYAAGVFNGAGDGRSANAEDFDGKPEAAARLFVHPFLHTSAAPLRGFGLGIAGSYGDTEGTAGLPDDHGYLTEGQQLFFTYHDGNGNGPGSPDVKADGIHWRLGPQAYWYYGPVSLQGDYGISSQELRREAGGITRGRVRHDAWHVTAGWVLTGEDSDFRAISPRRGFSPRDGGLGALQLVARYSVLDLDNDAFPRFADPAQSATRAASWGVGLNWILHRNVRASLDFIQTDFRGGNDGEVSGQTENAILTRAQLTF